MNKKSGSNNGRFKVTQISNVKSRAPPPREAPLNINLSLEPKQMLREGVNNCLFEYFLKMSLTKTLDQFVKEVSFSKQTPLENFPQTLIKCFSNGLKDEFYQVWRKYIPRFLREHDQQTVILEFQLTIYFTFFKIHPFTSGNKNAPSQASTDKAFAEFKEYLLNQGEQLTKIDVLLPYFALPYLKDPKVHPFFKSLFTEAWVRELQNNLESFLKRIYSNRSPPALIRIYENFQKIRLETDNGKREGVLTLAKHSGKEERMRETSEIFPELYDYRVNTQTKNEKALIETCLTLIESAKENGFLDDDLEQRVSSITKNLIIEKIIQKEEENDIPQVDFPFLKQELFKLLRSSDNEYQDTAYSLLSSLILFFLLCNETQKSALILQLIRADFLGSEKGGNSLWLNEVLHNAGPSFSGLLATLSMIIVSDEMGLGYINVSNAKVSRHENETVKLARNLLTNSNQFLNPNSPLYKFIRSPSALIHKEFVMYPPELNEKMSSSSNYSQKNQGSPYRKHSDDKNNIKSPVTVSKESSLKKSDDNNFYEYRQSYETGRASEDLFRPSHDAFFTMNASKDIRDSLEQPNNSENRNEIENINPMFKTSNFTLNDENNLQDENHQIDDQIRPSNFASPDYNVLIRTNDSKQFALSFKENVPVLNEDTNEKLHQTDTNKEIVDGEQQPFQTREKIPRD